VEKCWDTILGERVLLVQEGENRWYWTCETMEVSHAPKIRFPSRQAAVVSAAAMIFGFFLFEECTSEPVGPPGRGRSVDG